MRWHTLLMVLLLLGSTAPSPGLQISFPLAGSYVEDALRKGDSNNNLDEQLPLDVTRYEDRKLDEAMHLLTRLLIVPWPNGISPLLYVENPEQPQENDELLAGNVDLDEYQKSSGPLKRSRYYRKYPWKRQNSKYDPSNRFICNPSKDEVYRLLVALHEARQGNKDRVVDFCNRKRPAYAVYTNIRFLGK